MVSLLTAVEQVVANAPAGELQIFSLPEYFHEKWGLRVGVGFDLGQTDRIRGQSHLRDKELGQSPHEVDQGAGGHGTSGALRLGFWTCCT